MPDLGKYAEAVIGSYVATLVLLLGVVALSVWQSRKVKRALDEVERRQGVSNE